MVDQKIGQLVQVGVHIGENIRLPVFKLQGLKGDLAFNGFSHFVNLLIAIHKKGFLNSEKIVALNDQQIVSFVDQAKIKCAILAQEFWRHFDSLVEVNDG